MYVRKTFPEAASTEKLSRAICSPTRPREYEISPMDAAMKVSSISAAVAVIPILIVTSKTADVRVVPADAVLTELVVNPDTLPTIISSPFFVEQNPTLTICLGEDHEGQEPETLSPFWTPLSMFHMLYTLAVDGTEKVTASEGELQVTLMSAQKPPVHWELTE